MGAVVRPQNEKGGVSNHKHNFRNATITLTGPGMS